MLVHQRVTRWWSSPHRTERRSIKAHQGQFLILWHQPILRWFDDVSRENWGPLMQAWKACSYRQFTRVKMGPTAKYKWWPPILSWCDMGVYPRNRVPMGTPTLNIKWLTITLSIEIDNQVWISHFWTTLYDTIWSIEQCQNLLAKPEHNRWVMRIQYWTMTNRIPKCRGLY